MELRVAFRENKTLQQLQDDVQNSYDRIVTADPRGRQDSSPQHSLVIFMQAFMRRCGIVLCTGFKELAQQWRCHYIRIILKRFAIYVYI